MKKKKKQDNDLITLIKDRACHKRNVFENITEQFETLKTILKEYTEKLKKEIHSFDERIRVEYVEKSAAEIHLIVAGDILIFHMHSNVFIFDKDHHLWKSSYVNANSKNAYVGTIHIYNFLRDSIKLHRTDDIGYMIARIFINHENHYLVEGKKELGYKFNDFINSKITKKEWIRIIDTCLMYTLDFNLLVPPYASQQFLTVAEVVEQGQGLTVKTGKTLGFQFSNKSNETTF